jgi:hypothetical protein
MTARPHVPAAGATLALCVALLAVAASAGAAPPAAAAGSASAAEVVAGSPQRAASDFYAWYLAALQAHRDPFGDDAAGLARRVSAALVREIRQKMASPDGLDADYFLQAQDIDDGWLGHVSARPGKVGAATAVVFVDLGRAAATRQRLHVTLVREGGRWKISKVAPR